VKTSGNDDTSKSTSWKFLETALSQLKKENKQTYLVSIDGVARGNL